MAVTMSHRFDQDKTTLRRIVRSGVLGRINAIGMRFQGDMRQHMAWSSLFRHRMARPAADRRRDPSPRHHRRFRGRALRDAVRLDLEARLGGVRGRHRRASSRMVFDERRARLLRRVGVATRSASTRSTRSTSASTASTARRSSTIATSRCSCARTSGGSRAARAQGQKIPLLVQPKWINHWLIEQFAQWRDGGPPMETRVEENVHASAMVFAAIESQRTGVAGQRSPSSSHARRAREPG